ncbi:MAG: CIA30 family protein [Gammaproteobacteria bacterium]
MDVKQGAAILILLLGSGAMSTVPANDLIIDDRASGSLVSNLGSEWRMVTDQVMGGVSTGTLTLSAWKGRNCLRMQAAVSTDNNGGFVQIVLSLSDQGTFDASAYDGIELEVAGNNEHYNVHFRTSGLWLPWQSYRSGFAATPEWQTVRIAFSDLKAYRTTRKFRKDKLERIGLVAIGRDFQADLYLASVRFYRTD